MFYSLVQDYLYFLLKKQNFYLILLNKITHKKILSIICTTQSTQIYSTQSDIVYILLSFLSVAGLCGRWL